MPLAPLFLAVSLAHQERPPKDAALYTELIAMQMADQDVRDRFVQAIKDKKPLDPALIAEMHRTDAANRKRLKEIIAKRGWPSVSLVGKEAAEAAWLIVQHADDDVAFQEQVLAAIAPLVKSGEATKSNYAYLWDRVATNRKRPQRYGTQGKIVGDRWVLGPTEDPKNLDKRRAEMGLPPMAEYYKVLKQMLGVKSAGPG